MFFYWRFSKKVWPISIHVGAANQPFLLNIFLFPDLGLACNGRGFVGFSLQYWACCYCCHSILMYPRGNGSLLTPLKKPVRLLPPVLLAYCSFLPLLHEGRFSWGRGKISRMGSVTVRALQDGFELSLELWSSLVKGSWRWTLEFAIIIPSILCHYLEGLKIYECLLTLAKLMMKLNEIGTFAERYLEL